MTVGDRDHRRLQRGQPRRERAGEVLDQDPNEPLDRSEQRTVDHHGSLPVPVLVNVLDPEPVGSLEVDLDRGELPVAADRVADIDVDLRPVEGAVALVDRVLEPGPVERLRYGLLGLLPLLVGADGLVGGRVEKRTRSGLSPTVRIERLE